ncbi:chemotaxis protein CheA [Pseudogemmobacter hezensis]|uniref:chemotaxis protein CheA n=1 Tax=Pseudogemmobacter hezensis TaxID=2737662 RepID=UPI0020A6494E|nr:chemotaxis protein CheA [Pseudogemmobacter hezensis]
MSMQSIRDTFFEECEDLLEALAEGLARMESGEADSECLNAVFRAVHSIKGGAGAFALDDLVAFAHRFETVLDEIRSDRMELTDEAMHVLLRSADHLADLVEAAHEERSIDDDITAGFLANLDACLGDAGFEDPAEDADFGFSAITLDFGLSAEFTDPGAPGAGPPSSTPHISDGADPDRTTEFGTGFEETASPGEASADGLSPATPGSVPATTEDEAPAQGWIIHFRPWASLYTNGHDPFPLLCGLEALGASRITPDLSRCPKPDSYSPESPWLGWEVHLPSSVSHAEIDAHFEFVRGLCNLEIAPQNSPRVIEAGPSVLSNPDAAPPPPQMPIHSEGLETSAAAVMAELGAATAGVGVSDSQTADTPQPLAPRKRPSKAEDESDNRGPKPTLRVDLERVDRLINAVGELIINQAMIEQSVTDLSLPAETEIISHTEDYRLLARDLQEAVMAIRAQPVKPLFQRMSRIVREASEATGKPARLVTVGDTTEVDKTVVERLADPLTHMIRNAVDHGLENSAARALAGKDPEGTIRLSAAHRSGSVIITISDDGGGLDRDKVLAKAISRGLVTEGAELSDAEIDNLLFLPGFSTADKVSNLSGRGVGLDVVKNAVTALGGRIAISSTLGQGSEFTISLPPHPRRDGRHGHLCSRPDHGDPHFIRH